MEWFSRGYLPHRERDGLVQHVTVHPAGSLPREVRERIKEELSRWPEKEREVERRRRLQDWVDAEHGSCVLAIPEVAGMAEECLLFFHGARYWLHAWVVMPNHVHALYEPMGGWTLARIVGTWKKYTARRIREHLAVAPANPGVPGNADRPIGSSGDVAQTVWHREYWDRYIRNERHYHKVVEYIHGNPVKAGLARRPEDWPWSSAGRTMP